TTPVEALDWLAGWLSVTLDPFWDEPKRRLFVAHVMDFYRWRSTARGLQMALRLALEDCVDASLFAEPGASSARPSRIRIVEKYRTRRMTPAALGDPTQTVGPRRRVATNRWQPDQGGAALSLRYTRFLDPATTDPAVLSPFPIRPPNDPAARGPWASFALATL